jgi:hypothetical protein
VNPSSTNLESMWKHERSPEADHRLLVNCRFDRLLARRVVSSVQYAACYSDPVSILACCAAPARGTGATRLCCLAVSKVVRCIRNWRNLPTRMSSDALSQIPQRKDKSGLCKRDRFQDTPVGFRNPLVGQGPSVPLTRAFVAHRQRPGLLGHRSRH